jgi:hypothetical protein
VGHARVMLGMEWGSRVPVSVAWVPGVPVLGEHPGLGTRVHVGEHHPEGWVEVSFHSEELAPQADVEIPRSPTTSCY